MQIAVACCSPQTNFLTGKPLFLSRSHKVKLHHVTLLSCRCSGDLKDADQPSSKNEHKMAKLAIVAATAGVLALMPVQDASAAKSGGRIGGQAFRSSAPRTSGPRVNQSRTNIYINPPVAPPLVGGYGYGVPFGGGWGWSPFAFFTPGPSVAVGMGGGFEFFAAMLILSAIATVIRKFSNRADEYDDDY